MTASLITRADVAGRALGSTAVEDHILLLCTRQEFDDSHIQAIGALASRQAVDWELVFRVADAQGVSPLVGRNLQRCQAGSGLYLPEPVHARFDVAREEIIDLKARAAASLEDILAFLTDRSLEVMLLTAAQVDRLIYQDPALTFGRDLDLLIRADPEQLSALLRAHIAAFFTAQSSLFVDFSAGFGYEYEFFEYDYSAHHDLTLNGTLPFDFDRIWQDSIHQRSLQGWAYRLMRAEDLLISLCISSFRKRYFRLKNLCDVAECARVLSTHPNSAWRLDWSRLVQRARSFGAQSIVYTALFCAQQHLQAHIPAEVLTALGTSSPHASVIRWLVRRRSFSGLRAYNSEYLPSQNGAKASHPDCDQAAQRPSAAFRHTGQSMTSQLKHDLTLLLPLASYRPTQLIRKLRYVAMGRSGYFTG